MKRLDIWCATDKPAEPSWYQKWLRPWSPLQDGMIRTSAYHNNFVSVIILDCARPPYVSGNMESIRTRKMVHGQHHCVDWV